MSKELHSGVFVGGIVGCTELGADVVGSSNCGVVEQCLFSVVALDVREVLGELGSIEIGLQCGNVENPISRRDVNRDGDIDTFLCQYRSRDERSNEE